MMNHILDVVVLLSFIISLATALLEWSQVPSYPGPPRHHPITFANETHGFVLTGSTDTSQTSSDFYIFHEDSQSWTQVDKPIPMPARGFAYGVTLAQHQSTKAYMGFGQGADGNVLADWWELDMETLIWKQLTSLPGTGRRHPAMNAVLTTTNDQWEIHVGLGDNQSQNLKDWWIYDIESDTWRQAPDLPAIARHHPFYFTLGSSSFAGLGHSAAGIERDWFCWRNDAWIAEADFASYDTQGNVVTTEARVAGTQFSVELNNRSLGFVLSGDGDNHGSMEHGEFHYFESGKWHPLPPHPGNSRWAPGSFVMRGTARAYFTSGYDRTTRTYYSDVWMIDLSELFIETNDSTATDGNTTTIDVNGSLDEEPPSPTLTPSEDAASASQTFWFGFPLLLSLLFCFVACA